MRIRDRQKKRQTIFDSPVKSAHKAIIVQVLLRVAIISVAV